MSDYSATRQNRNVTRDKVETLRQQIAELVEQVRSELQVAEHQYDEYPEKGAGRYMKALGKLEGLEHAQQLISRLLNQHRK
jgi:hypothetical protein